MKNRFHAGVLAGILGLPVAAFGQAPPTPTPEPAKSVKVEITETTHEAARFRPSRNAAVLTLRKHVDSVEWSDVNFEFVIDWLREQGGGSMNVVPVWDPLGVEGVDREKLLSLSLRNTTVAEVLDETLQAVGPDGKVKYRAIGNTLRISTVQDFNRKMYVRVYDVTNLLIRVPDFDDAPEIDLTQIQAQGGGGRGNTTTPPPFSGGGGGGGQGEEEETEEEIKERLEELRKLIEETLEPTFWDTGGGQGSIRAHNKVLVIRASVEMHEEIAGFFSFQ